MSNRRVASRARIARPSGPAASLRSSPIFRRRFANACYNKLMVPAKSTTGRNITRNDQIDYNFPGTSSACPAPADRKFSGRCLLAPRPSGPVAIVPLPLPEAFGDCPAASDASSCEIDAVVAAVRGSLDGSTPSASASAGLVVVSIVLACWDGDCDPATSAAPSVEVGADTVLDSVRRPCAVSAAPNSCELATVARADEPSSRDGSRAAGSSSGDPSSPSSRAPLVVVGAPAEQAVAPFALPVFPLLDTSVLAPSCEFHLVKDPLVAAREVGLVVVLELTLIGKRAGALPIATHVWCRSTPVRESSFSSSAASAAELGSAGGMSRSRIHEEGRTALLSPDFTKGSCCCHHGPPPPPEPRAMTGSKDSLA
jgi:hypothetical protein